MAGDSRSLTAPGVVVQAAFREPLEVYERKQAMQTYESLKHTTWECKYHVVFIPKCRRKVLYVQLRRDLGWVFPDLAQQKVCRPEEELRRPAFLGAGLLGIDGGEGRGGGASIYPGAGERGPTPKTTRDGGALSASR